MFFLNFLVFLNYMMGLFGILMLICYILSLKKVLSVWLFVDVMMVFWGNVELFLFFDLFFFLFLFFSKGSILLVCFDVIDLLLNMKMLDVYVIWGVVIFVLWFFFFFGC